MTKDGNMKDTDSYIESLEAENRYLRFLLDKAGIVYDVSKAAKSSKPEPYDPDQGARIRRRNITDDDVGCFFDIFWSRRDVYSKRAVSKNTGKPGYYLQCNNAWHYGCHRLNKGDKVGCLDCRMLSCKKLEQKDIRTHLIGASPDGTDVIGVYPLFPDDTCRFLVFDFDNHEKGAAGSDFANIDNRWKDEVDALRRICEVNGIDPLVERSRSGKGAHIWIFFEKPISAAFARRFGDALLKRGADSVNLKSFDFYDRMLPMQDHLPEGKLGNLIALPLQGQALRSGNSAFIDENWNAYEDQWGILLSKPKYTEEFVKAKIKEWNLSVPLLEGTTYDFLTDNGEEPWKKTGNFARMDVDGTLNITLADGIYVDTSNLKPRIQNRIREMAAFKNPVYYKNQAMGLSNFSESRYIYLGSDEGRYLKVPRGLKDSIVSECENAGIDYRINDERTHGRYINVDFIGELKASQVDAVNAMLKHEDGILACATGFGKTVAACYMISQIKTGTLILLESTTLIEQWQEALEEFLVIRETPPEYETPSGLIRRRKSPIGLLQSGKDTTTGIIDIAMVGSVCSKGEFHHRLKDYGLVILDESHHAAADTIVNILQNVNARYVYGLTATPKREDGLEKVNYMLLGPVRYTYNALDHAKETGLDHFVYPRFTHSVAPEFFTDNKDSNKNYEILRQDMGRDAMIAKDAVGCIAAGRTPLILSRYVDQTRRLNERLKDSTDHIFMLLGESTRKEKKHIIEEMGKVPADESMILLATGSIAGEGFNYPRLDTLIMAMPVSGETVVEQYAGRLDREYPGKTNLIILDYVDSHIRMFDKMYHKRLRAYKQIGYSIYSEGSFKAENEEEINSIFDVNNYRTVFDRDLLKAKSEVIISSPVIGAPKVNEFTRLLKKRMEEGLRVIIVTWQPDRYGYGDSARWAGMQSELRNAGFELNLVEDYCERYCIVDREIVWYGSVNFLGKEDADDNLMRVVNGKVAEELLEITFGSEKVVPFKADDSQ